MSNKVDEILKEADRRVDSIAMISDATEAAENIIVSALAHQPEDDEKCYAHLCKAVEDVSDAIS